MTQEAHGDPVDTAGGGTPGLVPGGILAGRFHLIRRLGRGGIGDVWLAEDEQLEGDPVACKILRGEFTHDRRAVADLKREVLLTRRLRHPGILAVYTFWEEEDLRLITMEYIEGRNLAEALLDRGEAYTLEEVLPWVAQVAQALDYAHGEGILHRDVKPGNILLDASGAVRLADFGIARLARDLRTRLTGEMTCGTLLYVSPEQLLGEQLDPRSDLYSLAAGVYELLAGIPPFTSGSIATQIQFKPPPRLPHLSDAVNAVLLKALSKRPDRRFTHCGEFYHALAGAAGQGAGPGEGQGAGAVPAPLVLREEDQVETEATVALDVPSFAEVRVRLGGLLIEAGVVTSRQLEKALEKQRERGLPLGEVLIEMGLAEEKEIAEALSGQLGLPLAHMDQERVDPDVAHVITGALARARRCLPLRKEAGEIIVAMADPMDMMTIDDLESTYGAMVRVKVAPAAALLSAVVRTYPE